MITLKNGSKGEEVKTLQKKLNEFMPYGLSVDGIFGPKTEEAVRDFQYHKGLTIDGIVGPKTWGALGVKATTTNSKAIDPSVIYKRLPLPGEKDSNDDPLPVRITKSANRKPQYLAIHYTAGASSTAGKAQSVYNTFMNRSASADFAVDDKEIVQFNPDIDNYYCWSVGDAKNPYSTGGSLYGKATNKNTISIEICSTRESGTTTDAANHNGWSFTDAVLKNAANIAKIIMKKYNIPIERVVRHYDISGKLCPGVIGWNNETIYNTNGTKTKEKSDSKKWEAFKKRLSE